jgi:feruloyl esterase
MIETMQKAHAIDPNRIFVTGLSAGGAMTSVMLATYPELFAAGAVLAGIAYGCASDVGGAFDCMGGRAHKDAEELASHVRRASPHRGPWPRVQVWQGSADQTVVPSNAEAIVRQWTHVHGLAPAPDRVDQVADHPRRVWLSAAGEPVVEQYTVTGMAHGVPLAGGGEDPLGTAGAHMLDVGLSSTGLIAAFFGIAPEPVHQPRPAAPRSAARRRHARKESPASDSVGRVIENALRAAGLMR